MYLGEDNGNLSDTKKNVFYSQPFFKMRQFPLDVRKNFLIMSKKLLKMSNYALILSIFFS